MSNLAVSNIAWSGDHAQFFSLLSENGVKGVEVAPGKIVGGWENLTLKEMLKYRHLCENFGLLIPSFQAFLFGKPDLQLLSSEATFKYMREHISFVSELAAVAGARILVYGAPRSRQLLGYSPEEARLVALDRLRILAEICWENCVSIALEAVPETYDGEFITTPNESSSIVREVSHPGLVMHFDTGCTSLANLDVKTEILENKDLIKHFHISEPGLAGFSTPQNYHQGASEALKMSNYCGWTCIEMRELSRPAEELDIALKFVTNIY
ncbi:sugar phosphate isomerase/epimerase family protein [Halomonas sp. PA16-9]|uniref:sugar phosphate isomerase/epimerase family protein n=1 Tax=Halomonas sp. PA16-9 TaxID=2576841 RepID=UPI0012DA9AF2|nr:sugar phosphate isomerase/epimerase [Halomonas sp. PA16-9]